jgi:CRP-like cAMP-binding protein
MSVDVSDLIRVLNSFHPISKVIESYFRKNIVHLNVSRGERILTAGNICENIYFIRKGVLRGFMIDNYRDITLWMSAENELVTSIDSLDTHVPAMENIEAIEDCSLLSMTNDQLQRLYELHPEFNIVGRKLLQHYYRDSENRSFIARLSTAEQKYALFIKQYDHLANRVLIKYIASFLGVTLETLSRVRSKMSARKPSSNNPVSA